MVGFHLPNFISPKKNNSFPRLVANWLEEHEIESFSITLTLTKLRLKEGFQTEVESAFKRKMNQ